ncbi:inositol monophosphatase [Gammaproteobacteria bacterium]|nr:inositol monophosphatase [Gammaproteobacteria bacterium]
MIDILNNLNIAKSAAVEAGKILINFKTNLNIENTSDGKDIKLKADIEAEEFIKRHISSKSNLPMLGEETGKSVEDLGKSFWVIDPLDGTANYSRGIPICCVSIALIHDMQPVIGVIYDFNNEDLYEGSLNSSACLNGEAIEVNNNIDEKESILLTGLPLLTDYSDSALIAMTKDFQKWKKIRMIGSAAMASAYVASGKADMYKESGAFLWDVAAGAAIINAANGEALITNQKDNYQVDVAFTNRNLNK